jgi:hypothetical protein
MKTKLHPFIMVLALLLFTSWTAKEDIVYAIDKSSSTEPLTQNDPLSNSPLSHFVLVNATSDYDMFDLEEGTDIDVTPFFDNSVLSLNIRAQESGSFSEPIEVKFILTGPINRTWIERTPPYALFGDFNGDYLGMYMPPGNYHLVAGYRTLNSAANYMYDPNMDIHFTVSERKILRFEWAGENSDYFLPFAPFFFDKELHGINHPFTKPVVIKAVTNGEGIGSVKMQVEGPISYSRIENEAPYSLFGDINGTAESRIFPKGSYTLTATPYSDANGQGVAGDPFSIGFAVDPFYTERESVELINAPDGSHAWNLEVSGSNNIVYPDRTPTDHVNILVKYPCGPEDFCPESVYINLEGPIKASRTENVAPYTLFGDNNGIYNGANLPKGNYNLVFVGYSGDNLTGFQHTSFQVQFEIIDYEFNPLAETTLFPNPTSELAMIQITEPNLIQSARLFDIYGNKVMEMKQIQKSEKAVDVSQLPPGLYFVHLQTNQGEITKKLIVQ